MNEKPKQVSGRIVGRTTSRGIARALGKARDMAMAFVRVGGFIILWEDKSRRARMTTIDTAEFLGATRKREGDNK